MVGTVAQSAGKIRRWLFRRGGMKRTLLVPFILLLVFGFGASWLVYFRGSRAAVLSVVDALTLEAAHRAADRVESYLGGARQLAGSTADFAAAAGSAEDMDRIRKALRLELLSVPEVQIASVGYADGSYVEAQRLPDGEVRTGSAGAGTGGALVLEEVDQDGNPVREAFRREGYDPRERPWYLAALAAGGPGWTAPYAIISTGAFEMAAFAPAFSQGRTMAVATANIGLAPLSEFLDAISGAEGGFSFIVDADGLLVAGSRLGGEDLLDLAEHGGLAGTAAAQESAGRVSAARLGPAARRSFAEAAANPGRPVRSMSEGVAYRATVLPIGGGLGLSWKLVFAVPENVYLRPLKATDPRVGFILLVMLAASILLAFLTADRVMAPLRGLGASVAAYAPGRAADFGSRTRRLSTRGDEIGRLANSFGELAGRLDGNFAELESSLAEKEVLLREVHHRVKNNLQIVSSLVGFEASQGRPGQSYEGLERLQERIQAMAFVHDDVYDYGGFEAVDMGRYLSRIADSLCSQSRTGGSGSPDDIPECRASVEVTVKADECHLDLDRAITCGLVANELIGNAIKHAFVGREAGKVRVGFVRREEAYVLTVEDDGRGLSSPGGAIPPRADGRLGIGGQLVRGLVAQLHGSASAQGGGNGTAVRISFPVE